MWPSTLFLWSSDNGGDATLNANNHPLRGGKGTDFEGGVRVVSFLAGGVLRLPPGSTIDAPIHLCDWCTHAAELQQSSRPALIPLRIAHTISTAPASECCSLTALASNEHPRPHTRTRGPIRTSVIITAS
jgi:hypothetical protein